MHVAAEELPQMEVVPSMMRQSVWNTGRKRKTLQPLIAAMVIEEDVSAFMQVGASVDIDDGQSPYSWQYHRFCSQHRSLWIPPLALQPWDLHRSWNAGIDLVAAYFQEQGVVSGQLTLSGWTFQDHNL